MQFLVDKKIYTIFESEECGGLHKMSNVKPPSSNISLLRSLKKMVTG